jgi:hypothetical protein
MASSSARKRAAYRSALIDGLTVEELLEAHPEDAGEIQAASELIELRGREVEQLDVLWRQARAAKDFRSALRVAEQQRRLPRGNGWLFGDEMCRELGIQRRMLSKRVAAGDIESRDAPGTGRGRPKKMYRLKTAVGPEIPVSLSAPISTQREAIDRALDVACALAAGQIDPRIAATIGGLLKVVILSKALPQPVIQEEWDEDEEIPTDLVALAEMEARIRERY